MYEPLPDWLKPLAEWLTPTILFVVAAGSLLLFVLGVVGVPIFVARLPEDFLSRREQRLLGLTPAERPVWYVLLRLAKNLLGLAMLIAGIFMLVLPGQGLLTILVALMLLDFPGKKRIERRFMSYPPILKAINSLRRRAGKRPIRVEAKDGR